MTEEPNDETVEAPPEASDPSLSSSAKNAFFANAPEASSGSVEETLETPERHPHHSYDVKAKNATDADANFDAEETNPKVVSE